MSVNRCARPNLPAVVWPQVNRSASGRLIEPLESRTLLSAGNLDPTFGLGGKAAATIAVGSVNVMDVANGRVVLGGTVGQYNDQNQLVNGKVALAVFDSAGNPVKSFSGNGVLVQALSSSVGIRDLAVQPDNKIVVLANGRADDASPNPGILARFNADGSIDKTFGGGDGEVALAFGQHLALAPGGRVVVAGLAGDRQVGVARFTSSGTLEKQLLSNVVRYADTQIRPSVYDLLVRSDGKIVVGGAAPEAFANPYRATDAMIVRFKSDLTGVDTSFGGGDGLITYNGNYGPDNFDEVSVMTLDASGRLLASVTLETGEPTIHRFLDNGSDDPAFTKTTVAGVGAASGLSVAPDGKIVWSGTATFGVWTFLSRVNPNGGFDTSFGGGDGIIGQFDNEQVPFAGVLSEVQPDGRIITAGSNGGFAAWRHAASNSTPVGTLAVGSDAVLRITGTEAGKDEVWINDYGDGGSFQAYINGRSFTFDSGKVKRIDINTLGANDVVRDLAENAAPTSLPRVIHGGPGNDVLYGGAGKDQLIGEDGNDQLHGSGNDDTIIDGPGTDLSDGGLGADTVDYSFRSGPVYVDLQGDADDGPAGEKDTVAASIEHIIGSKGNDTLVGDGRANYIDGRGGNDTIYGGGGNDTLVGGLGQDKLYGQDGNDFLDAKDGVTDLVLDGGAGTDTARKDNSDPRISVEVLFNG